ncbi:hypothetical protein HZR84_14275 [Hyphobacterium sp. CCMP332]|nr:hypothetical protein HZR84_14275 [Hyphobacterium sp. CCMP332]
MVINVYRKPTGIEKKALFERLITLVAKNGDEEEKIIFSLTLRNLNLDSKSIKYSEFLKKNELHKTTKFGNFDVIIFQNLKNKFIKEFWWSKSMGYVRIIDSNGFKWDLLVKD